EATFSRLPERDWTLLVQAVDLWVPEVGRLLDYFDFLPRWRLDDIMVSFAPVGGSVGPHFDQYDVFLLQVEGERNWQIGDPCDETAGLVPNVPVRMLADFVVRDQWLLSPGDLLYLPPGIAHWGVSVSNSLTFSIGFRSPSVAEMVSDLAIELMVRDRMPHYRDPPSINSNMATGMIDPAFVAQVRALLYDVLDDEELLSDWFARYMTAPKYPGLETESGERRAARTRFHRYLNGYRDDGGETS
ncbi:MAG: cupin domain-containing protein, partial [Pseudomonadales bacterium]